MMSHSSSHPCAWCDVSKENLKGKGKFRTISSLMNLFWDFFDSKGNKKNAKNYGNVIHPPILSDNIEDETPVISVLPPPELHLLIGPVNKIYSEMEKVWPESQLWLKACNVKKEAYHGGTFAGDESRKLLTSVSKLQVLNPPKQCKKFINVFTSLNKVVTSCYGSNLSTDFNENIKEFQGNYSLLGISVTPKVHAVMYHISEFCMMTQRGLGAWSEQCGESVHHDFNETWQRFKVNDVERSIYADNLLKCVILYNSQHV